MNALIGYTGFVGSNLLTQFSFDHLYNSQNINKIKNKSYDLIVSAGTPALRWQANQDPKTDWLTIKKLIDNLQHVRAKQFVLISTIDVYPQKDGANEKTKIRVRDLTEAYGKHRYKLEKFVVKKFRNHAILRCPQIYGKNLKKGFIYDLINNNALDFTHKDSSLQFYNAKNFKKDIDICFRNNIKVLNLSVEPTTAAEVAMSSKGIVFDTVTEKPPLFFDMQTIYGHIFKKQGPYLYSKKETLDDIKKFVK